ncbi:MAG: replication initiator protein A [Burkholderiales bacterium]|nr:replication initiator protein A [Burkholderiales bacterium]
MPSEFEYDVFNAILALRAISEVSADEAVEFSAKDIIKLLRLTGSGTNYSRITEAVKRLMSTWYWFDEFFERKLAPEDGMFPQGEND